jgi:hypothetical protein
MTLEIIKGGFSFTPDDEQLLMKQRAITKRINDNFIQVGAVFLKAANKNPFDADWYTHEYKDTNLQSWVDDPALQDRNVGFNLQLGWMDVDIDANDPEYNRCIVAAMKHLGIDTRFKFGRMSVGYPTHVFIQLGEDESANFEYLTRFEPKAFKLGEDRFHVQLRSYPTRIDAKNLAASAKQTVVPGSVYSHKREAGAYDISVWYGDEGIADSARDIAATTPRKVSFNEVVRAVAFGTFLYCVRSEWVEGQRQSTAGKLAGWLARIVLESQAMNNQEAIAKDVFCPVDTDEIAQALLEFVGKYMGDDEVHMRIRTYRDAKKKLEANPDAKIPGWPSITEMLGGERVLALRGVFMPGSDVAQLTKMAERYLYDETDNRYVDRQRFKSNANYVHPGDELLTRHKGDTIKIGGKPIEAFRIFESSDLRKRVGFRDLYPDLDAGGVYRIGSLGDILSDVDEDDTALSVFNTWRGWPVSPAAGDAYDPEYMKKIVADLDHVLSLITRDNADQMDWVKQWLAWTLQHPGDKQQIALVVVGDQGIGKSWFGNIFVRSLMGPMWGSAAAKVLEGDFSIGPFKDKMFVFIDEARFHNDIGVEEIKKLIRGVDVPGMEKFQEARNYRIFARMMFASNRLDLGVGQQGVRDRALFYVRTYDREYKKMSEMEFRTWAETLKPFFTEFTGTVGQRKAREHFMRYFMEYPADKYAIESIKHSSGGDSAILIANMGWARKIAIAIVEDGRIFDDLDISYPFTLSDFNKRVVEVEKELGMRNVQGARVMAEFEGAGVIERIVVGGAKKLRFTDRIGSLTEKLSKVFSVEIEPRYVFDEKKDYGPNDCDGSARPAWKGARKGIVAESKF